MKKIQENELNGLSLNEKLDLILHALGAVENRVDQSIDRGAEILGVVKRGNKIPHEAKVCDSDESGNKIQAMVSRSSSFRITPID